MAETIFHSSFYTKMRACAYVFDDNARTFHFPLGFHCEFTFVHTHFDEKMFERRWRKAEEEEEVSENPFRLWFISKFTFLMQISQRYIFKIKK